VDMVDELFEKKEYFRHATDFDGVNFDPGMRSRPVA